MSIEQIIGDIEDRTSSQCKRVAIDIAEREAAGEQPLSDPLAKERLFAAMVSGRTDWLSPGPFEPGWVSWIEDVPPYLWLSHFERVVVDLIPCTALQFFHKYGITPDEMITWITLRPGRIFINVRDDSPAAYANPEVNSPMRRILELSRQNAFADSVYRLQPVRETAFKLLRVPFDDLLGQAKDVCATYTPPVQPAQERLRPVARNGQWLVRNQLATRIAYYESAKKLWTGNDGFFAAADETLDEWLGELKSRIAFDPDEGRMIDLLGRLYTVHHLYTAHLTGALGGKYGWIAPEMDFAASTRPSSFPGQNRVQKIEIPTSQWLFDLQAGYVGQPGQKPPFQRDGPAPAGRSPWEHFLINSETNRQELDRNMAELLQILAHATDRAKRRRKPLPSDDVEKINTLLDGVASGGTDVADCIRPLVDLGVVAAPTGLVIHYLHGITIGDLAKIFTALMSLGVACGVSRTIQNRLIKKLNGLCPSRIDRTVLSGIMGKLQLPPPPA